MLLWLLPRRIRSSWVLLAITSFGILAAITLMAVGAIYSRALADGGLRHTLATTSKTVLNAHVLIQNRPLGPADYGRLRSTVDELAQERLGPTLQRTERFGRGQPNLPLVTTLEQPPALDAPVGRPFFFTGFEEHSRIVEGRWPERPPVIDDAGLDIEVVIGKKVASFMRMEVDSQAYIMPFKEHPSERIAVTVVGLAEPIDPADEYWMGTSPAYFTSQDYRGRVLIPIYVPEETFFDGLGTRYPTMVGDYGWLLFLDTDRLTAGTAKSARNAMTGLETDLNKRFPRTLVLSGLENALADYQRDLTHARVPLFLFLSLVVVVILYFLVLVMGLLSRTQSDEASLLRSRGSSMLQVSGLLVLAEGAVTLVAMVVGPFLALLIVRHLLLTTVSPAGDGGAPSVGLSGDMFIMGAVGGILSLGILIASGTSLARLGMVEFLRMRARPPTVPFLQRYYVDLLVLAAMGLIWWQLRDRGGFVERDVLSGALEGDLSLRLGPVLVLLGAALVVLRFLPLLVRFLAWVGSVVAPAWVSLSLGRVARDPLPHGSLTIMLMIAAALGVFGATFQSTLSRSQREQSLYELGGEVVIKAPSLSSFVEGELAAMTEVRAVSPVGRFPGGILAVDPDTLPRTAWFRDDFADKGLDDLFRPLRQTDDRLRGILLPSDASAVGVWVNVEDLYLSLFPHKLSLWMRVSDAEGRYRSVLLGDVLSRAPGAEGGLTQGWTYLEGQLPSADGVSLQPPFKIASIFLGGGFSSGTRSGSIAVDDITVKGPSTPPDGVIIEGYEDPGAWVALPNSATVPDTLERTSQVARTGRFGLKLSWKSSDRNSVRGILIPPGPFPLPVVGGPTLRVGQALGIKSDRWLIPVVVKDVVDYFPTMNPLAGSFVLLSLRDYEQYIRRISGGAVRPPEEFWVSLEDGADRSQAISSMRERLPYPISVRDSGTAVDLNQRYPLAGGGWTGLTILGMSAMTMAAVLALGLYAVVSVHTGRVDLTVVRVLGLSRSQVLLSLALERALVALLGIAAGTAIGIWLSRWVLGFLDITAAGEPVIPPMIVTFQGWLTALVFLELVAAVVIAIGFAAASASKLRTVDILRRG